jgi:hypothetical protein
LPPENRREEKKINDSMGSIGIEIESDNPSLKAKVASNMFDTTGK